MQSTLQANRLITLTSTACIAVMLSQPVEAEFASNANFDISTTESSQAFSGEDAPFISEEQIARFQRLAEKWRRETMDLSSLTEIVAHPAYLEIISMDKVATPLILAELERQPGHWFVALAVINKVNPVPAANAGNMKKMRAAWLKWGRERLI